MNKIVAQDGNTYVVREYHNTNGTSGYHVYIEKPVMWLNSFSTEEEALVNLKWNLSILGTNYEEKRG